MTTTTPRFNCISTSWQIIFLLIASAVFLVAHYPQYLLGLNEVGARVFISQEFVLLLISAGLLMILRSTTQPSISISKASKAFLALVCVMLLLDIGHGLVAENAQEKLRFVPWSKVLRGAAVCALFYTLLTTANRSFKMRDRIWSFFVLFLTTCSIAHCWMWIVLEGVEAAQASSFRQFFDNNHLSYESLAAAYLIAFTNAPRDSIWNSLWVRGSVIAINLLPAVANTTRGAILIAIGLFFLGLLAMSGRGLRAVAMLTLPLCVTWALNQERVDNVFEVLILALNNAKNCSGELTSCLSMYTLDTVNDGLNSAYLRVATNIAGIGMWLENPLVGVGSWAAYRVDIMDTSIHSLVTLFITSYGLMGVFFVATLASTLMRREYLRSPSFWAMTLLLSGTMLFDNQIQWWYAFVVFLSLDSFKSFSITAHP